MIPETGNITYDLMQAEGGHPPFDILVGIRDDLVNQFP
jgi:hypothetical protein